MSIVRRQWRLVVVVLLLVIGYGPGIRWAVAQEQTALLPTDPAMHRGRLDNGMAYWVRSHATPPGKIAFWLHVDTGSLNEDDGQEGLAHYLEHMAFNGTENFPPGELIKYFESIGLRFGQHQNAFTSFDQTTYLLTLPNTQPETIDKGMLCLADFASRILLTEAEVEKERNVILEEKRARKGVGQRLTEKLLPDLLPGSRVARRLPIGLEESIAAAKRQDLRAYYSTWYHPAKVTLLAVGDAPVDTVVAAITKHFATWQRPDAPPTDRAPGVMPYAGQQAIVITDPELTTAEVETLSILPRTPQRTVTDARQRLVETLGTWILNRRLQQLIQEGKAAYQAAQVQRTALVTVVDQYNIEAQTDPQRWAEAFTGLLTEMQRAHQYGFTERELADVRQASLAAAEHAAQTEATQDARAFLQSMNRAVSNDELPLSAAQRLQLLQQLLPGITREEVHAAFSTRFDPNHRAYVLSLPEKDGLAVPDRAALLAHVRAALATPVGPWQESERLTALLAQAPQPGAIVEQTRFAPLEVTHVTFANNVRVHYRFSDFKKDHVTVAINLAGGKIREVPENRGITQMALLALNQPSTSRFSSTAIRDFMTGKKVSVTSRDVEDAVTLEIAGAPEALEDGLQLAHVLLQDAKLELPSVTLWKNQKLQEIESTRTRIEARVREAAEFALSGRDPRQAYLTAQQVTTLAANVPQAQAWLDTILRTAPVEVAIVGDLPEDRALQLAATYLGSLPARQRQDPSLTPLRQVPGFTGPLMETLDIETITPRAHLVLMWRCTDWQDVQGRRLTQQVTRILERRLRQEIREERGLTYSTNVYARSSKVYPLSSALFVEFTTAPDKVEEAVRVARTVVETFAAEGPTAEEMAITQKQLQNTMETTLKEPGFWVGLLADMEYHGTRLEDVDGLIDKLLALQAADVAAEAKKTILPDRFAMVVGRPMTPAVPRESPRQPATPVGATR